MRGKITVFVGLVFMLSLFSLDGFANEKNPQKLSLKKKTVQKLLTESVLSGNEASKIEQKYRKIEAEKSELQTNLLKSIEKNRKAQVLQKQAVNSLSERDRIKSLVLGVRKMRAEGLTNREIHQTLQQRLSLRKTTQTGSISGRLTTSDQGPIENALVFAFDLYGYMAGDAVSGFDGNYTITDLPAGDYFVVTETGYLDEFYDDVLLNDYANWLSATTVNVPENGQVANIDFELAVGGVISGVITDQGTGTPLAYNVVFITVYSDNSPNDILFDETVFTDDQGRYSFTVGDLASYKIHATVPSYIGEFYDNKPDWDSADLVDVVTQGDTVKNINFALEFGTGEPPAVEGNVITGSITSELDNSMLNFVLVFAFDLSDTSIAGFGLSGLALGKTSGANAVPNYTITGLDTGSYIVVATDLLQGYNREFYQEATTPDDATPITFATSTDTAFGIDFTLDMGGSISGTIINDVSEPLTNVLVIALKGSLDFEPFFTNIDIGFDTTDAQGNYNITGLSSGNYILRTLAMMNESYAGIYLDEWYDDVHNLLAFNEATEVVVTDPDETSGIDFQLERAGVIAGTITAADGTTPVLDVAVIVAIDTSSSLPQLASFEYSGDNSGDYTISMLEPGDFKLYAYVDPESEGMFISEFYNGVSSFEDAAVVTTAFGDTTDNINFTLEQGGMIQGFVQLSQGVFAGADTLSDFPVVAYNAVTGEFAGATFVSFTGGFRIPGLPEGDYKLAALPVLSPFAATYFGGGNTYDDANSSVISVTSGNTQDADILLEQANGGISGSVSDAETSELIDAVFVFAYDNTGHVLGVGVSGMDIINDEMSDNPGVYVMGGLRTGSYYVRTFAIFRIIQSILDFDLNDGSQEDPFSIFGNLGDLFSGNFYKDEWYDDVAVNMPEITVNSVVGILEDLRYSVFGLFPFYQTIPGVTLQAAGADGASAGIMPVSVTDGSITGNIDFVLGIFGVDDLPVSVEDNPGDRLPGAFQLGQSYPNPIQRSELANGVTINFELIETKNVAISVYNVLGQKVATILNREIPAGYHNVQWNGKDSQGNLLPSGVYFYALSAEANSRQMKKLIILR